MSDCTPKSRPVGPCKLPCPRCGEERWGIHRNEVPATSITRYGFVCDYCWQYAPESLHCHPTLGPVALGSCYAAAINFRLEQHRENLGLWESGFLAPTEPDPDERRRVMDHLRVAINELEEVLKEAGPHGTPAVLSTENLTTDGGLDSTPTVLSTKPDPTGYIEGITFEPPPWSASSTAPPLTAKPLSQWASARQFADYFLEQLASRADERLIEDTEFFTVLCAAVNRELEKRGWVMNEETLEYERGEVPPCED